MAESDYYILEPVHIIRRKGIELAIELLERLNDPRCKFMFTHVEDAELDYLAELQSQARAANVPLQLVMEHIGPERGMVSGYKIYTLWDAYVHADFVMYPSVYEGFGNALLETVYFRKPMLVNNYIVYAADIGPLGFQFVEIDFEVTDAAVEQVRDLLAHPDKWQPMVEHNYALAEQYFSYSVLERLLAQLIAAAS